MKYQVEFIIYTYCANENSCSKIIKSTRQCVVIGNVPLYMYVKGLFYFKLETSFGMIQYSETIRLLTYSNT